MRWKDALGGKHMRESTFTHKSMVENIQVPARYKFNPEKVVKKRIFTVVRNGFVLYDTQSFWKMSRNGFNR